ncbi:dihydromonapterin reductase / dihydrofolate reductase [Arsukibacterium tuosuense]|uniref:Dihydromonapterin reductase n=1 Tax=Arsukibacterium tuosuense TaxID=1323745 RepID=A0A285IWW1_9GAMM|nr:dihydromonapterin reductase [Arsukibacterium tuosuense]SNY52484.1 dihydromonapterin reductase / dihydrofolate reductase [Arsukibacterium tuosuense]
MNHTASSKGLIVITGAGQRVGLHCATALLQQGYQLLVSYRKMTAGITALQQAGARCIAADFTQLDSMAAFIDALAPYPAIRAIIHNASSWQADLPLQHSSAPQSVAGQLQQDAAVFDAMQHIHARAPYLLNRALLPKLRASPDGADIIHLTDFVASVGSSKHQAYAASKAALENLTFSLARQLAPNVKVNAIAPALLMFNDSDDAAYRQKALTKSLMAVAPGPDEVLQSILYLLNSKYITGRVLALDGGRHLKLP